MTHPADARIDRVLETALYFDDLTQARHFYADVLGFEVLLDSPRLAALNVGGTSVLLLFQRGESVEMQETPGGLVPGHGAHGAQHVAFAVGRDDVDAWHTKLQQSGIVVESTVTWPRGGLSIYFRDCEGHSVELITEST